MASNEPLLQAKNATYDVFAADDDYQRQLVLSPCKYIITYHYCCYYFNHYHYCYYLAASCHQQVAMDAIPT